MSRGKPRLSRVLMGCLAFFLKNDFTDREGRVMPSLFNREGMAMPSLSNREGMAMPSLFNREGMAMPSLSNREGMAMPSLLLCFTPNTQGRHMKSFDLLLFTRNEI